jgi:hypothetical protein
MDLPTYNSQIGCGKYYMLIGYELLEKMAKKFKRKKGTPFAASASFRSTYA